MKKCRFAKATPIFQKSRCDEEQGADRKLSRARSHLRNQAVRGLERSYSFSKGESILAFERACAKPHFQ